MCIGLALGSPVQYSSSNALLTNNYALVCVNKLSATRWCQKLPYEYYCTANGKREYNGEKSSMCEDFCESMLRLLRVVEGSIADFST